MKGQPSMGANTSLGDGQKYLNKKHYYSMYYINQPLGSGAPRKISPLNLARW